MPSPANRLIHESSPYLQQHAHNPVDWYPWGPEAFERAKREDKPVLVSIGYAACHWCHVMERESFENPEVAAFMNEHFINIKVDREERPDVDHIYMDALQAMSGTGGWPLNVFVTPEGKPFYGGTYFPPRRAFNRSSWTEVLQAISEAYREKREEVEGQAGILTDHLRQSGDFRLPPAGEGHELFQMDRLEEAAANCLKTADREWGGFGAAPKFPQTFALTFLLRHAHLGEKEEARAHALLSLDRMIRGGIYDQAGGGFARYSTDREWLAPHFEKMLYDNALLISTLSEAFQLTGKADYARVIEETVAFLERELMDGAGGFYSALDADSEGEEGKFYVWDRREVEELLGAEADLFCDYYDIRPGGNWEGKSILRVLQPLQEFARSHDLDPEALEELLAEGRQKLLARRDERVRPALDDKVLLGWNALLNSALSRAYAATGNTRYRDLAVCNARFLSEAFRDGEGRLCHSWKEGRARHPAFLDDYAGLVAAFLDLAEVTADYTWLDRAAGLAGEAVQGFSDEEGIFFYFTHRFQQDVLYRKKEIQDGATPSGNALMAGNLYRLALYLDRADWRERAYNMVRTVGAAAVKYPTAFGVWLALLQEVVAGTDELAIVGEGYAGILSELLRKYQPHRVVMAAPEGQEGYPLLRGKGVRGGTLIYRCRNYACEQPVDSLGKLSGYNTM